MNASFIKEKVRDGKYDLSIHARNERQEEQITVEEIEKVPRPPVWIDYKTRAKELKIRE